MLKALKANVTVYETVEDTVRIEYKNRVIQVYSHGGQTCCFVMKEDGNDDKEFFCLLQAMKYIDKVTK